MLTQTHLKISIEDCITKQLGTREHCFTDWKELTESIPHDESLEGAFLGSYSLTYKNRKKTLVDIRHNWCGRPVSASTISRLALEPALEALGRKRFFWTMKALPLLKALPPFYVIPGVHPYLIYADISAAYYSIYRYLPLYLYYWGLKPIYGSEIFDDYLPHDINQHKLVRNSVVGTMRSFHSTRIRGGKIVSTNNRNTFLMPCHWGCMVELLHLFAQLAIDCGAIYYNTDGAIFTDDESALKWCDAIRSFGLDTSIKGQGGGQVQGLGAYKVGTLGTIRLGGKPRSYNNIKKPNKYVIDMFDRLLSKR